MPSVSFTHLFVFIFFMAQSQAQAQKKIRYVALGDSYTIGTGATESEAWPVLLAKDLNKKNIHVELIANPSRNGFSTENLIERELPVFDTSDADFVTVLIGVNDWVRGVDKSTFTKNLVKILDHVQKKLEQKKNILLVTIPDFGVTPQGAIYSKGRDISKGIAEFNEVIKAEAKKRDLMCVDVYARSQKMQSDPTLVSSDGLHPSAKEYAEWEKLILPAALKVLSSK